MSHDTPAASAQPAPILQPVAPPPRTGNVDPSSMPSFFLDDFAVVDTETTGMDPQVDKICEIAIVRFRRGVPEVFHTLVDPEVPIPPTASAVHHITDAKIREANSPTFQQIADKVIELLDGAEVYSHNRDFDEPFVNGELGVEVDVKSWNCTYRLARHLLPHAPAFGNQVLRYWLQTNPKSEGLGAHRAIDDVYVTLENLYHLWSAAATRNVTTHQALHRLCDETLWLKSFFNGKQVGKDLSDPSVPMDYFEWALGMVPGEEGMTSLDDDARGSLRRELERRMAAIAPAATLAGFGKEHRDKPLQEVPIDYLEWMASKPGLRCAPDVMAGVKHELRRRREAPAPSAQQPASSPAAAASVTAAVSPRVASSAALPMFERTFRCLASMVNKGCEEERKLLGTRQAADPEVALAAYLRSFAAEDPRNFERVASRTEHDIGAWMRDVAGIPLAQRPTPRPAGAALFAGRAATAAPEADATAQVAAAAPSRVSLLGRRADDLDDDEIDHGEPPEMAEPGIDRPFQAAPAPRRMRAH